MHLVSNHLASFCVWSKTLLYWATVTRLASRSTDLQTNVIHNPRASHSFLNEALKRKRNQNTNNGKLSLSVNRNFYDLVIFGKTFLSETRLSSAQCHNKNLTIQNRKKEHLQIKERRWIPFDVFAPPKEKWSPGEPSSGWIVIPHLISVGLVLYCGGPLFTWVSIYLRRESC